nr:histone H1/H5 [Tanacetum cinerariifolium]
MATEEVVVPVEAPVIEEKGDVSKVKKAKKVTKSKPKSPALHPPYFEKLVAGGKLVKVKASYKLPSAAAPAKAKKKVAAKPKSVAKKAPVAKAIAAKKTPVKKASVKSLKPKAAIAKKVSAGRKAKK